MSSAGFPLIGPHTEQTCTIDFNFNFVQNSTQSFILNCMIEFLDWASPNLFVFLLLFLLSSPSTKGSGLDFQIFFVLYLIFNINIYSPSFQFQNGTTNSTNLKWKITKLLIEAQWKYLNKILNIRTLTSKLYRKWYYVESWIINLTLNYNQVNHYLKLRNEAQLFQ